VSYLINKNANTAFTTGEGHKEVVDIDLFERALLDVHKVIAKITEDIPVDIFSILGMRNLSAFIGELFAMSLAQESNGHYISNPHQDGYPDLLLMNDRGVELFEKIRKNAGLRDKSPFSPFPNGGLEIKATCGSVPTPTKCAKMGIEKPDMGDTRISVLCGYDWKAHHRETNNLVGILWDFINSAPHIVAVFFGNNLSEEDWGRIVQPKEGGGRTTSVSIMSRDGVKKMYCNWIAVKRDPQYIKFLNKYNRDNLIPL
jgi:hypothetical protein